MLQQPHFVSYLLKGTTTGLLWAATLRVNSSVSCSSLTGSTFLVFCGGGYPFEMTIADDTSSSTTTDNTLAGERVQTLRVGVPGDLHVFPWNHTLQRQDLTESLFIESSFKPALGGTRPPGHTNFAFQCTGSTTFGYSILPNYSNNNPAEPLLGYLEFRTARTTLRCVGLELQPHFIT